MKYKLFSWIMVAILLALAASIVLSQNSTCGTVEQEGNFFYIDVGCPDAFQDAETQVSYEPIENFIQPLFNQTNSNRSNLAIWDSTDEIEVYANESITFYANHTDGTKEISGECYINFLAEPLPMDHDLESELYIYELIWMQSGEFSYSVSCSAQGYEEISSSDVFVILENLTININDTMNNLTNITLNETIDIENLTFPVHNVTTNSTINETNTTINNTSPGTNSTNNQTNTSDPIIIDQDNDSFNSSIDCDDNNSLINPNASEILYNNIDDDCNPDTPDSLELGLISSKQTYNIGEIASIAVIARDGSDTYLTINTPKNISYVYIFNNESYPQNQVFLQTNLSGNYIVEAINYYEDYTLTKDLTFVVENDMSVQINSNETSIEPGDHIKFSATVTGGTGGYTYIWDFGDGVQSTVAEPDHKYTKIGTYYPIVEVKDEDGNTISTSSSVIVRNEYDVTIRVLDSSEQPLEDAGVWIDGDREYTNSSGYVEYKIENGTHELKISESLHETIKIDIEINSSHKLTYTLVDKEKPPVIELILPKNSASLGKDVVFKYNVDEEANCTLHTTDGDGWWTSQDTRTIAKDTNVSVSISFENGDYEWKIECTDTSDNTVFSTERQFSVAGSTASGSSSGSASKLNGTAETNSDNVDETYPVVQDVLDVLPNIESFNPDQKSLIKILKLDKGLDDSREQLERANADMFNLRYIDDSTQVIEERDRILERIDTIKNNTLYSVDITKKVEFVKYVTDEEVEKVSNEYMSYKNIDESLAERFTDYNLEMQKLVGITTKAYNLDIEYLTGRKETITLIQKTISIKSPSDNITYIESIPKNILSSAEDIVIISDGLKIIVDDPILEANLQNTKEIVYYFNRKISLDNIPKIRSVIVSKIVPDKKGGLSAISGFVSFEGFKGSKTKVFFLQIIVIAVLISVYIIRSRNSSEPETESEFAIVLKTLTDTEQAINIKDIDNAAKRYEEIKLIYHRLTQAQKDQIQDRILTVCSRINESYAETLVDHALVLIAQDKRSEAVNIYKELEELYETCSQEIKNKVYEKCEQVHKSLM